MRWPAASSASATLPRSSASASLRSRISCGCCAGCAWSGRGAPGGWCSTRSTTSTSCELLRVRRSRTCRKAGLDDRQVRRLRDSRRVDLQDRGHGLPRGSGDPRAHAEAADRARSARRRRPGPAASRQARRRRAVADAIAEAVAQTGMRAWLEHEDRRSAVRGHADARTRLVVASGVLLAAGLLARLIPAHRRGSRWLPFAARRRARRHSSGAAARWVSRRGRACSTSTS